jgi:uncharacterized protein DUF4236
MGWRWRKSVGRGPLRINLSRNGIGWSLGVPGLRVGRSPSGKGYVSQSIPGTGLYRIKYFGDGKKPATTQPQPPPGLPGPAPQPPPPARQPQQPLPAPLAPPSPQGKRQGPAARIVHVVSAVAASITRFFDRIF